MSIATTATSSTTVIDPATVTLSADEIRRYSRHLIIPEFGMTGQKKLKAAKVLLVGTGGLGSPVAMYLAAAGAGTLGLVDFDNVDDSDLQRQLLHGTKDVGKPKIDSAAETLANINPYVKLIRHNTLFTSANALDILKDYDYVVDGTDNFPTRYLVNDASVLLGKINVYGSIFRFEGQVSVFGHPDGPCYRCMFPTPPPPGLVPSCAEGGVLGILPGTIGTIQATEVIKLITGLGEPLVGRMVLYDALEMTWDTIRVRKNPKCPICGDNRTIHELIDYEQFCGIPANNDTLYARDVPEEPVPAITVKDLKASIDAQEKFFLLDVRELHEADICTIGGTLIPKSTVQQRLAEIPRGEKVIVYCRMGSRSAAVVEWLREAGYQDVWNLTGGILAWAEQIDTAMPTY